MIKELGTDRGKAGVVNRILRKGCRAQKGSAPVDYVKLQESYRKLGVPFPSTEGELKEAYHSRKKEARAYKFRHEPAILKEFRRSYKYILAHRDIQPFPEQWEGSLRKGENALLDGAEVFSQADVGEEELLPWAATGMEKAREERPVIRRYLAVIIICTLFAAFLLFVMCGNGKERQALEESIREGDFLPGTAGMLPDSLQPYGLGIGREDISSCRIKKAVLFTGLRAAFVQAECTAGYGEADIRFMVTGIFHAGRVDGAMRGTAS